MNPRLVNAIRKPHASTDISVSPYGSISDMNTPPRKLLNVENSSSASRPGTSPTARMAPADVDDCGRVRAGLGRLLRDADRQQMDRDEGRDDDGDDHARAHAEEADRQAAEHRGDRERHPVRRADQPVRTVAAFLRHQEGHRRREGDGSQVAGDRAGEHERDERPEREGWPRSRSAESGATDVTPTRRARRPRAMIALESSIDVRRRCRSTNVPKNIADTATRSMYPPPMIAVARTDRVSR